MVAVRNVVKYLLPILMISMSACATVPKAPPVFRAGATLETLTASVGLSVKTPAGGTGGNGYLVYSKPDRFRMVMLTPFGTTAVEFCATGDKATVVIPSKGVAYAGSFADLPERGGLQSWRLMKWAMEGDPLLDPAHVGEVVRSEIDGQTSLAFYNAEGLLERKSLADGSQVRYHNYESVDGVPLPSVIEFSDPHGTRAKITISEPEVNKPLEEEALRPHLEGLKVMPLYELRGM